MQRRNFLQATGAGSMALLTRRVWALPASSRYLKTLGLQLYTLRNQLAEDIPGTIKAVADAGYYQVELMRVVGDEPIFQAAGDHGLKVTSAMIDWKTLVSPGEQGVPSFQETLDVAVEQKLSDPVSCRTGSVTRPDRQYRSKHPPFEIVALTACPGRSMPPSIWRI